MTGTALMIREARVDDAAVLAALHVATWQVAYRGLIPQEHLDAMDPARRVAWWRDMLSATAWPRRGTLVAEVGGPVAGFAYLCPSRDDEAGDAVGEIAAIYLHPDHWGTGVGRTLMAAAVDRLTTAGYLAATLWVLEANTRARRFYAAAGWHPDGATKPDDTFGFPMDQVRYRRVLR